MAIHFHESEAAAGIKNRRLLKKWLEEVIQKELASPGSINIVLTSDKKLSELNQKYLSRKSLTDIITFDYTENQIVAGELYISVPRVRENAEMFSISFQEELKRVMVHGILHLLGYEDNTETKQSQMRGKEDYYLARSPEI